MPMIKITVAALALLGASLPAFAQNAAPCVPADKALPFLKEKYHEVPKWQGELHGGQQMVLTQSPEGDWSIVVFPHGQSGDLACLAADGVKASDPGI